MKLQKLPPYEVDVDTRNSRTCHLTPAELGVYTRLMDFYWRWGELPVEVRRLAAIGAVHVRSFERMSATLIPLFDVDDAGVWRDTTLEEQREKVMQGQARRSKAAALAAEERWRRAAAREAESREAAHQEQQRRTVQDQGGEDERGHAMDPSDALRSALPDALPNRPENAPAASLDALPDALRPIASRGSIDRSSVEDSESIDRSIPGAGACAPHADGTAKPAPAHPAGPGLDGANRTLNASAGAIGAPASETVAARPVDPGPSDAELHARVLSACGDNITAELRQSRDVEPIRALMRDGFDLEREILPFLRDRVKALSTPLRSLRPGWIRKDLEKARVPAVVPRHSASGATTSPLVFVATGTPEWDRWQAYGKESGKQRRGYPQNAEQDGKRGWRFPSLTPPPLDRAAAAAE